MTTDITMPRLSDSMEQGTVLSWLKSEGDHVAVGDELVEIETDKATMMYAAEASGILHIVAQEGASLPIGATIASVAPAPPVAAAELPDGHTGAAPLLAPHATSAARDAEIPVETAAVITEDGVGGETDIKATPLARRVADVHGLELNAVSGSGPLGRITRADVLSKLGLQSGPSPLPSARAPSSGAAAAPPAPPAPAPVAERASVDSAKGDIAVVELSRVQAVIARRMSEAKATIPHFQVQTDVAIDAATTFRAQLKDTGERAPSLNDLIVKAAALALRNHPLANGSYRDGRFELHSRINVGIAVAAHEALIVPTIFDADDKSLGAIARESRRLVDRVREGTATPAELSGATFTVSNLGMYGMTAIAPVINLPQAAILGVGAVRSVLARVEGEIVDLQLATLTLSCDHRILYVADV